MFYVIGLLHRPTARKIGVLSLGPLFRNNYKFKFRIFVHFSI